MYTDQCPLLHNPDVYVELCSVCVVCATFRYFHKPLLGDLSSPEVCMFSMEMFTRCEGL